ncbi:MAG: preprotein translocase subunit SecA [Candidatus Puniceispirillaceae bacterium]
MLGKIAKSLFGDKSEREVKQLRPLVDKINAEEPRLSDLSDSELVAESDALKQRVADGTDLDDVLVPAFALVREAAKRTLGQRHYDVQLMGGIILHRGQITEMKTGEGKTLVTTLAVYLNALSGRGVHVVTVNDYLAQRDSAWMGQVYRFLGLSVGCVTGDMDMPARKQAYACDVTYGTNNEFGFDYLRDNLKFSLEEMVQREHHFAIVDEVDSILIDEARTPLIISGPAQTSPDNYIAVNKIFPQITADDYDLDEKARTVSLTETGIEHAEEIMIGAGMMEENSSLYDGANISLLHHLNQALRAHLLFQRDTHYMVRSGELMIIDEFTGRAMTGRRFSDGLHQALEAKEGLQIQAENQTLASVTYQNYFRLYDKLAGMTGTALTEAGEFSEIYGLHVVPVPTNNPIRRLDHDDEVYRTSGERDEAVIELIKDCQKRGQPILVGTVTIEKSESLSAALKKAKISHQVLNARFHEEEANIIAEAGVPGAVTIATNMAGRGTDIQLGGNAERRITLEATDKSGAVDAKKAEAIRAEVQTGKEKALAEGGLYVVGTERHESRRIDNQLRGRTGRQGDPGGSKFFLSLEDDLMRIFGSDKLDTMLQRLGLEEGEAIAHPWINKAVEKAQSKVEAHNFEIRKQILKYDDVMNDQRQVVFAQRKDIMQTENVHDTILEMRSETIDGIVEGAIPEGSFAEQWDTKSLQADAARYLGIAAPAQEWADEDGVIESDITERLQKLSDQHMANKGVRFGADTMRMVEKSLLLQVLDQSWKEHLLSLDQLRQGINLRAYAQKDPLNEYKRESFELFEGMLEKLRQNVTMVMAHVELQPAVSDSAPATASTGSASSGRASSGSASSSGASSAGGQTQYETMEKKTPRNAPCPCGSGKKYKHCHGKVA